MACRLAAELPSGPLIVHDKSLVVHAPIHPPEIGEIVEPRPTPLYEGIEKPNFDQGMAVKGRKERIQIRAVIV